LLRAPTPEDKAARRAEAHQALTRLQNGARFDELAVELSDDQGSKISGGDLGFIARGKTVRPFEDAAFSLASPGDLSEIVETKFGLHILKLEGRRAAHQRSFEEVRDRIVAKLRADYTNQQLAGWKDSLVGPAAARVDDGVLNEFLSDVLPKNQPAAP
jgi:peptidyl-prolyl cis-trans isomerase C